MNTHQQQRQEQITALVKNYRESGLTRTQFCQRIGMSVSTLDYYRRQVVAAENKRNQKQKLVRVVEVYPAPAQQTAPLEEPRFTIVLTNGRRIETKTTFDEATLARLIRVVEAVA